MNAVKLYSMAWQDRSDRVRWLLEELKVPYENRFLSKPKGELESQEYLQLNPMGRVPTLVDNKTVIHESCAIALYLADKYRNQKVMAPEVNSEERPEYLKWMVFSVGSLEAVVARMFYLDGKTETEKEKELLYIESQCNILARPLEQILSTQEYLLKSGFSAADIMVSAVLPGAQDFMLKKGSVLNKYMIRISQNENAKKVNVFEGMSF